MMHNDNYNDYKYLSKEKLSTPYTHKYFHKRKRKTPKKRKKNKFNSIKKPIS